MFYRSLPQKVNPPLDHQASPGRLSLLEDVDHLFTATPDVHNGDDACG